MPILQVKLKKSKGHTIRIDAQRQMLCASDMCKVNPKKEWDSYKRNKSTKEFIKALKGSPGIIGDLIDIKMDGLNHERGTWVSLRECGRRPLHIKIAMDLARWISPRFALFVFDILVLLKVPSESRGHI